MKKRGAAAGMGLMVLTVLSSVATNAFAQVIAPATASETAPRAAPPGPGVTFAPDLTVTACPGLITDYRSRGFMQTGYKRAFQSGLDLSHVNSFYDR